MSANRLAALTGLAFVVLAVISGAIMGEPPDPSDDSVQEIVSFYQDNDSEIRISAIIGAIGLVALVFFAAYLGKVLRAASGPGHISSWVVLAGATVLATGAALDGTINLALAETADDIDPSGVQALSALWNNDYIPLGVGAATFALAAGLSIVRHGGLPKWLGWVAIVLAVITLTPIGFAGFIGTGLWIAVASVMLFLRADEPAAPTAAATAAPPATYPPTA
jgi:hypothetical protein